MIIEFFPLTNSALILNSIMLLMPFYNMMTSGVTSSNDSCDTSHSFTLSTELYYQIA